jgi:hypothetical protein
MTNQEKHSRKFYVQPVSRKKLRTKFDAAAEAVVLAMRKKGFLKAAFTSAHAVAVRQQKKICMEAFLPQKKEAHDS